VKLRFRWKKVKKVDREVSSHLTIGGLRKGRGTPENEFRERVTRGGEKRVGKKIRKRPV